MGPAWRLARLAVLMTAGAMTLALLVVVPICSRPNDASMWFSVKRADNISGFCKALQLLDC